MGRSPPASREKTAGGSPDPAALRVNPVTGSALVSLTLEKQWPLMEPRCHIDYTRCGNWWLILTVTQGNIRNQRAPTEKPSQA